MGKRFRLLVASPMMQGLCRVRFDRDTSPEHGMPFVVNDGVRIRYETEGNGTPLVLHGGFRSALEDWSDAGYVAALRDRYRVVALDPRSQGQSEKPHDPAAYADRNRIADVLAVLDAEGIERAHYWGYSLGATYGFLLAIAEPQRLLSLIAGGGDPFPENAVPIDSDPLIVNLRKGTPSVIAEFEAENPHFWSSPGERARWLANDAEALIAARTKRLSEPNPTESDVAAIRTPTLVYVGSDDQLVGKERAANLMPNATFVLLNGLSHADAFRRADLVLPPVLAFLAGNNAFEVR
jgi:pimeloyl-ACP methyl ester carboxylesterase